MADNGHEFISKKLDLWAIVHDVTLDFSRRGKPTDNAFIESLNGKFRAECLNANCFLGIAFGGHDLTCGRCISACCSATGYRSSGFPSPECPWFTGIGGAEARAICRPSQTAAHGTPRPSE